MKLDDLREAARKADYKTAVILLAVCDSVDALVRIERGNVIEASNRLIAKEALEKLREAGVEL